MTDKNQYLYLGRLKDEKTINSALDKTSLEVALDTSNMTFREKLEFNLKPETWKNKIVYGLVCARDYFGK
ncbi:MAG: hypothetical protein WC812_02975 [Candidatus Pacearchaeota archaeon]|jgi:hypothetical protein